MEVKLYCLIIGLLFIMLGCSKEVPCNIDETLINSNDSIISVLKTNQVFLKSLEKMEEKELPLYKTETYRFMIVDSWRNIESHRINKNEKDINYSYRKDWIEYGREKVDTIKKSIDKKIGVNDWNEIKRSLDELKFWELPIDETKPMCLLHNYKSRKKE